MSKLIISFFFQLLLIGGNVKEALHELEMFGGYSNASLPTRYCFFALLIASGCQNLSEN